eukprot:74661-Prorocentrum_minimum.AAC.1
MGTVGEPPLRSTAMMAVAVDLDNDGDLDLFVTNNFERFNEQLMNDGSGKFTNSYDGPAVTLQWDHNG